jgi:hypothetical protein
MEGVVENRTSDLSPSMDSHEDHQKHYLVCPESGHYMCTSECQHITLYPLVIHHTRTPPFFFSGRACEPLFGGLGKIVRTITIC